MSHYASTRANKALKIGDRPEKDQMPPLQLYRKVLSSALNVSRVQCPQLADQIKTLEGHLRAQQYEKLYNAAGLLEEVSYEDAEVHFCANQIVALIKKYPWGKLIPGFDPRKTAEQKFRDAEAKCLRTNNRFRKRGNLSKSRYFPLLLEMRRWIKHVIGEHPDYKSVYQACDFGTGASVGVHGNATHLARKLRGRWTVTRRAIPHAIRAIHLNDQLRLFLLEDSDKSIVCLDDARLCDELEKRFEIINYNLVSFVPKTAKTHRAIAVEPTLNNFIQTGIDKVLRRKLLAVGIDLKDQSRNGELARIGSLLGSYSTIDLTSASDTIAMALCSFVLPPWWYQLLSECRTDCYKSEDGSVTLYNKMSSMGNGFTFPLETLIFAAAVNAVYRSKGVFDDVYRVYGDDIIVRTDCAQEVLQLLRFCGFTPNKSKTFVDGPFRESCGKDWYAGQDVRPVYLDSLLSDTASKMAFHNATLASPRTTRYFSDIREILRQGTEENERLLRPDVCSRQQKQGIKWEEDELVVRNLNGAFSVPLDLFMTSRQARWNRDTQSWSWQEFRHTALEDENFSSDASCRYLNFLKGSPEGRFSLRRLTARRRVWINPERVYPHAERANTA